MRDTWHLPTGRNADVWEFTNPSTVTNTQWQTWRKPRGASVLSILCVGGGGGGGGGFTGAAASARGGGGGGGGSAQTTLVIPAIHVPDVLYIQVGAGGQGQVSGGGAASNGVISYVSVDPRATTANNVLCLSGNAAGVGGGTGTGAAVGAAGTAGTIATIANMPLAALGNYNFIAGQIGTAGGAVAGGVGGAQSLPTTGVQIMGGVGGGGVTGADQAGGLITAVANTLVSDMRPINAAAGSFDGPGGYNLRGSTGFFFSYPGMGGGASNAGVGGNGGNGFYGSGGGGGGGGTTGGRGGVGGNGIVIIAAW